MPEHCTCGTLLVEQASFCHRCGRPTSPLTKLIVEDEPAPPPPPPTAAQRLAQLPVSFSNPIALRIGFMLALAIVLVDNIPFLPFLFVVWCVGGGWIAVLWYRRLTGSVLNVRSGARLGSITGVMTSAALAIEFALASKEIFEQAASQDARLTPLLTDSAMRASVFLVLIVFIFACVVGLCAAGGALGARYVSRRSAS